MRILLNGTSIISIVNFMSSCTPIFLKRPLISSSYSDSTLCHKNQFPIPLTNTFLSFISAISIFVKQTLFLIASVQSSNFYSFFSKRRTIFHFVFILYRIPLLLCPLLFQHSFTIQLHSLSSLLLGLCTTRLWMITGPQLLNHGHMLGEGLSRMVPASLILLFDLLAQDIFIQ